MPLLQRISATLTAQVERLVGEIENHDAVVEAGIRDQRRAYAQARVRLARMSEEGERLRRRSAELGEQSAAWRQRAVACADEDQALECLRRAKQTAAQAQSVTERVRQHAAIETRLTRELEAVQRRVQGLEQRRHLLRSREATANAACRVRSAEGGTTLDLDDTFDRWEVRVFETELDGETSLERDLFEAALAAEEERTALRAELAGLKGVAGQAQTDTSEQDLGGRHEA